ncbi:MAG: FHA domain-containing protein [Steroidobacteraceae bacterium]
MSTLGLHVDDAAIALARDGAVLSVAPAIVDAGLRAPALAGQPALQRLRATPQAVSSRHWLELATGMPPAPAALRLVRAELMARSAAAGIPPVSTGDVLHAPDSGPPAEVPPASTLQVAVPALLDPPALARLLAVIRAAGLPPVAGFVDAAAASAAALALPGPAIAIELGLHHVAATRVDFVRGESRRRAALVRTRAGLLALQESWLQLVSEAMVLRTRFDPLHDAATEQQLYDLLPGVAARAAATGGAAVALGANGESHEVTLSRDQFAARGEGLYREIAALVHELRPAGAPVTLLADRRLGELPGLREALAGFRGCELVLLPAGFAAAAVSMLGGATTGERVHLRRGVAHLAAAPADSGVVREILGGTALREPPPTHVLWGGRAMPLTAAAPIEIGRAPAAPGIELADGLAGVSRLHCTLRREADAVVLVDHSRYGTRVNGERVAGRVRLRAGDRVQIGDPGVEIALISVGGADGATA